MIPYADSNFITRLYIRGPDTADAREALAFAHTASEVSIPMTWLHRVEVKNAFQLFVFTGVLPGQLRITPEQAAAAHASFRSDLSAAAFLRAASVEVTELEQLFEELSLRYSAQYGFRTYDILHVASARLLGCDSFWSFDGKANKLARLEGLRVLTR